MWRKGYARKIGKDWLRGKKSYRDLRGNGELREWKENSKGTLNMWEGDMGEREGNIEIQMRGRQDKDR